MDAMMSENAVHGMIGTEIAVAWRAQKEGAGLVDGRARSRTTHPTWRRSLDVVGDVSVVGVARRYLDYTAGPAVAVVTRLTMLVVRAARCLRASFCRNRCYVEKRFEVTVVVVEVGTHDVLVAEGWGMREGAAVAEVLGKWTQPAAQSTQHQQHLVSDRTDWKCSPQLATFPSYEWVD